MKFKKLSAQAQTKVLNDTMVFLMEAISYEDMTPNMKKAINKAEKMRTPWFAGEYLWDYAKKDIMKIINSYDYDSEGYLL